MEGGGQSGDQLINAQNGRGGGRRNQSENESVGRVIGRMQSAGWSLILYMCMAGAGADPCGSSAAAVRVLLLCHVVLATRCVAPLHSTHTNHRTFPY